MTRAVTHSEILVQGKWGDKGHLLLFGSQDDQDECYPKGQKELWDLVSDQYQ